MLGDQGTPHHSILSCPTLPMKDIREGGRGGSRTGGDAAQVQSGDSLGRANIRVQLQLLAEGQVQRAMSLYTHSPPTSTAQQRPPEAERFERGSATALNGGCGDDRARTPLSTSTTPAQGTCLCASPHCETGASPTPTQTTFHDQPCLQGWPGVP